MAFLNIGSHKYIEGGRGVQADRREDISLACSSSYAVTDCAYSLW
jgi:hypothetical protein